MEPATIEGVLYVTILILAFGLMVYLMTKNKVTFILLNKGEYRIKQEDEV